MDAISLIITCVILVALANGYEKRQRKKAERKRKAEEEADMRAADDYYRTLYPPFSYEVEFPNPATVPIERVADFLENENRVEVVDKYIEIAKERQAPQPVIDLIVRKRQEMRDLLDQAIADAGE